VGADRVIQLYDGKTGEAKAKIGQGEHKGSIFAVSWAKDSNRFVTASADQTVKIWDAEAGKAVQTWRFGGEGNVSIPDHQVGVVWPAGRSDGLIISLNLTGDMSYVCSTSLPIGHILPGADLFRHVFRVTHSDSTFLTSQVTKNPESLVFYLLVVNAPSQARLRTRLFRIPEPSSENNPVISSYSSETHTNTIDSW
jgi:WD40 repeat protein